MSRRLGESSVTATAPLYNCNCKERIEESKHQHLTPVDRESIERKTEISLEMTSRGHHPNADKKIGMITTTLSGWGGRGGG